MIDSLNSIVKLLLIDRHYSYKKFAQWQSELIKRGIRQVLDLRSTDHNVLKHPDATYANGSAHCPAVPDEYFAEQRPGIFGTKEEHFAFQAKMAAPESYAHVVLEPMNAEGRTKLRCPARAGKVACPLYPPSMLVAAEAGLEIVNTHLMNLEPGQELPRCCTQDSFRVTLPESVAKLNQKFYWASTVWYRSYARRSYVEGVFGNMKNPRTENLRRGTIQKNGLVWAQLMVTLIAVSYNVRVIRARHDRMEFDPIEHPLLSPDAENRTHRSLSVEEEAAEFHRLRDASNATLVTDAVDSAKLARLQQAPPQHDAVA